MLSTVRAIFQNGRIKLLEPIEIPEGTHMLVTLLLEEDERFWLRASQKSLDAVWENSEDDVYAELLTR
ncbi:MAG: antitoxin family protein [Anaerolineales bacterium]|nr:antitoxin family protein [Anaerolineales bacterium]